MRWLFPAGCLALGLYLLRFSYRAYSDWQAYLALGDFSGAELPETEFWFSGSFALALILLSTFLAGRWSVRRPQT